MNCYLISKRKLFVSTLFIVCLALWQCSNSDESSTTNSPPAVIAVAKIKLFNINFMVENSLSEAI